MEGGGAVFSSTLWPKDFPELKLLDDALRCNICYDYIKTCMVTPCAHSYCSKCIRTSLLYKTACPSCFEETFDNNLRNNRVLDRVVELFVSVKDKLLKHLQIAAVHFNNCNDNIKSPFLSQSSIDQKNNKSILESTPKSKTHKSKSSSTKGKLNFTLTSSSCVESNKSNITKRLENILGSPSTNVSANDDLECLDFPIKDNEFPKIPPMFLQTKGESTPKVEVPSYDCPVCGVNIPERNMNAHLDTCLANVDKPVKSPIKTKQKRSPLKKMVWSLMSEKDLRKKLKDYGLNTQGDKKALISRLQRYVLLYNSECDSDNPRPISEIIRLTEKEEKQIPMQNQQQRLLINKKTDPKLIEEENKKYIKENKESFKKLIVAMRNNAGKNTERISQITNEMARSCEDDLPKKKCKKAEVSNISELVEIISLSDTNDDVPSSPVLGEIMVDDSMKFKTPKCSSNSHITLEHSPKNDEFNSKVNEIPKNEFNDFLPETKPYLNKSSSNSFGHSSQHFSSPKRLPSPSCIITEHSDDSSESLSLLIDHNIENNLDDIPEADIANIPNSNSQWNDPDFFVDTEDLFESNSDEVFQPRRKSKRKLSNPVPEVTNTNVSPRRTRRRLNQQENVD